MTNTTKIIIGVVAVLVIAFGAYKLFSGLSYGGVTNSDEVDATAIKVGGTNGSRLGPIISTTCNLSQSANGSFAATTTKEHFCAVTGVSSSDTVIVTLPAGAGNNPSGTAASLFGGFIVGSAYATTTGFIGVSIYNGTGAATSSYTQATTSVIVTVLHSVSSVPGL